MTRTLLWDSAPGEIRCGLIENGKLTEFKIIRPFGPHAHYISGEYFTARITQKMEQGRALVSLGADMDAMLEQSGAHPEGALIAVEITRAPIAEPGRWKRPIVKALPDISRAAKEDWHAGAEPWQKYLLSMSSEVDEIICPNTLILSEILAIIGLDGPMVKSDPDILADADFDSLIDTALIGEFPIAGGMLSIERTRAMTMIDIDGSGDPLVLNLNAAKEIPNLLKLYGIGGQIGIDFLAVKDRRQRQHIDSVLMEACHNLGQHERTATNGFGFAQIIRPRPGPSIPEILCGITPARLTIESRATMLLRAAARSTGHGRRTLTAAPAITEYIEKWLGPVDALRAILGTDIVLVPDSAASGYGNVHVQYQ